MRAITVRHPWAWAIIHLGKDVENRTRNIAGSYRGPLLIHAGCLTDPRARSWYRDLDREHDGALTRTLGHVIGVVTLTDVVPTHEHGMPEAWAEPGMWWLRLTNPQPLTDPIPTRGRLGLWTPDQDVLDQAQTQLQEASS